MKKEIQNDLLQNLRKEKEHIRNQNQKQKE